MAGERERGGGHRGGREERDSEFVDKLVHINRVAKVVKGGKRFGFAALVVIGDQKGRVGFGHGKAREVPEAIRKATESAKRNLTRVALREGRTLHHDIAGRHGAGRVYLRPPPAGARLLPRGGAQAVGCIMISPAVTAPAGSICARRRRVPASSRAVRCARCSRRSAFRTWWRSRSARRTPTTWFARRSTR